MIPHLYSATITSRGHRTFQKIRDLNFFVVVNHLFHLCGSLQTLAQLGRSQILLRNIGIIFTLVLSPLNTSFWLNYPLSRKVLLVAVEQKLLLHHTLYPLYARAYSKVLYSDFYASLFSRQGKLFGIQRNYLILREAWLSRLCSCLRFKTSDLNLNLSNDAFILNCSYFHKMMTVSDTKNVESQKSKIYRIIKIYWLYSSNA